MRFRRIAHELRYTTLRTDLFLRVIPALRHDPKTLREVLYTFGKLEHAAFHEGVEQGGAAALTAVYGEVHDTIGIDLTAARLDTNERTFAELHATLYAHEDTPLQRAEERAWARTECRFTPQALTADRPGYVPLTLEEIEAEAAGSPAPQTAAPEVWPPPGMHPHPAAGPLTAPASPPRGFPIGAGLGTVFDMDPDPDQVSPALLDQIRDALLARVNAGWRPEGYREVVLLLMEDLTQPAHVIDAAICTPQGHTVVRQARLLDLELPVLPGEWEPSADEMAELSELQARMQALLDQAEADGKELDGLGLAEMLGEGTGGEVVEEDSAAADDALAEDAPPTVPSEDEPLPPDPTPPPASSEPG